MPFENSKTSLVTQTTHHNSERRNLFRMNAFLDTISNGKPVPVTILGMASLVVGLLIIALSLMVYNQSRFRVKQHSAKTKGIITGWKTYELGEHTDDFPIVEFTPKNGETKSLLSKFNAASIPTADNAPENMPVIVYYNPNDPNEFSIANQKIPIITILVTLLGIGIFGFGIYTLFIH